MTYLEIVNKVLKRLRESQVTTVGETEYSALIGEFVNDVKREVEDAWDWSALRSTLTVTTEVDAFNYVLIGSGIRSRIIDIYDDTNDVYISPKSTKWFDRAYQANDVTSGQIAYYNLNGVDSSGDTQIDFYPPPDAVCDIRINAVVPQAELSDDTDVILVPFDVVIEGTVARAQMERGLDGGNMDLEMRYKSRLSDYIAIDSKNRPDELMWVAE